MSQLCSASVHLLYCRWLLGGGSLFFRIHAIHYFLGFIFFASKRNSPKRRMNNWNRNTHLFPQQQKPNQMSSYHRTPAPRMNMQAPCIPSASAFQPPFPRTDTPAHTYPIPPFQPNPSWANIASKPPPPSNSTIPGYLKYIINFLHGSIQKL